MTVLRSEVMPVRSASDVVVAPGDSLWAIAADHLPTGALESARDLARGRVICVFGAGGTGTASPMSWRREPSLKTISSAARPPSMPTPGSTIGTRPSPGSRRGSMKALRRADQ